MPVMILKMPMIVGNMPDLKKAAIWPMSSFMRLKRTRRIRRAT